RQVREGIWIEEGAVIGADTELRKPCIIGADARIGPGSVIGPYACLGNAVNIGRQCQVRDTVILNGASLGDACRFTGNITCSSARILDNVTAMSGSILGSHCVVYENVTIQRDTSLWPGTQVMPGMQAGGEKIQGTFKGRALFGRQGITGIPGQDIPPWTASKTGSAWANLYPEGSRLIIAADGTDPSRIISRAMASGAAAAGAEILEAEDTALPELRKCISFLGCAGGIHVRWQGPEDNFCRIVFLNQNGLDVTRQEERKIENTAGRGDFRMVPPEEMGMIRAFHEISSTYRRLLSGTVSEIPPGTSIALALRSSADRFVSEALREAGVNVIEAPQLEKHGCLHFGSMLGAVVNTQKDDFFLVDSKGRAASGDLHLAISALITAMAGEGKEIRIPVTSSTGLEMVLKKFGARVTRTRTSMNEWMQGMDPVQFDLCFDPPAGILRAVSLLHKRKMEIDALFELLPAACRTFSEYPCPWEMKGSVMRRLMEENREEVVEAREGVKLKKGAGWALILPDAEKPVFRILTEAATLEAAEEIAADSRRMLLSLLPEKL
ncbi:MAG TPA: hypothetical protein DD727_09090, partial [Clostridiales bacterium]|nr:hypothetical protein [Clostridiales bacterium]